MLTKPKFKIFAIYTVISDLIIYLLLFFFNKEKINYYLCTNIKSYDIFLFSRNIELIYPESCDLNAYKVGVLNIQNFYNLKEYVYFDRPLFIFYISIFYYLLKVIFNPLSLGTLTLIKASFFLGQIVLTSIVCVLVCLIFNHINLDYKNIYFSLPWMISISPMFKWHIYESTSMTFTFLIFLFGIYFVINLENINQAFYFFLAGLLVLVHRSAVLIVVFIFIYTIFEKKINFKTLTNFIFFIFPILLHYTILFLISGFADHQAEGYRQFIWIIDYLNGKDTINGGYFCQTPNLAFNCYLNDLKNLIKYLFIPIIYLIINYISFFRNAHAINKNLLKISLYFAILINLFWLFIGWYPPIRFSYYGLGNLVIFLMIYNFALIENKTSRNVFIVGYTLYFLFLNHWNYPEVILRSNFILISAFLFLISIITNNKKILINDLRD